MACLVTGDPTKKIRSRWKKHPEFPPKFYIRNAIEDWDTEKGPSRFGYCVVTCTATHVINLDMP